MPSLMMNCVRLLRSGLCAAVLFSSLAEAQTSPSLDPHLYLSLQDFEARKALAISEPWAREALSTLLKEADGYPQDYLTKFGLTKVEAPEKGAQWAHWYVCPDTGTTLQFKPPNHNIC